MGWAQGTPSQEVSGRHPKRVEDVVYRERARRGSLGHKALGTRRRGRGAVGGCAGCSLPRSLGPGREWGLRCRSRLGLWLRAAWYGALDLSLSPVSVTWGAVPRASFPLSVK